MFHTRPRWRRATRLASRLVESGAKRLYYTVPLYNYFLQLNDHTITPEVEPASPPRPPPDMTVRCFFPQGAPPTTDTQCRVWGVEGKEAKKV